METVAGRSKEGVRAFFRALEAGDADRVAELFAEDGVHINPYHSGLFPEAAKGRAGVREYWAPVFENFGEMEFRIHELLAMEDPSIAWVRYSGKIQLPDGAGSYDNDYFSTFRFDEAGKVVEYVEIFNPITAARAFGLLEKIQ